jgi:uncharacterized protein YjbI with pentapeptide repeats
MQNKNAGQNSNIILTRRVIGQEALKRLAAAHQRFARKRRDGRRVILQNCTLAGLDFQGMCFAQAHFVGCRFTGARLVDADFSRARLFASSFEQADLTRTNFERADLRAVVFDKAILNQTRFDQADLRKSGVFGPSVHHEVEEFHEIRSSFRNADIKHADLRKARMKNVDFTGARLEAAELRGADLRGTRFTGADLDAVDLNNALLHEADLRGASFENMAPELSGVLATPLRPIDAIALSRALHRHETWLESDGKQGERADFSAQNLAGLDLAGRGLAMISFAKANLKGIDLSGAVLAACDFSDANLRGAELSRSDLRGALFTGAHLDAARFEGARIGVLPETGMKTTFPDGLAPDGGWQQWSPCGVSELKRRRFQMT